MCIRAYFKVVTAVVQDASTGRILTLKRSKGKDPHLYTWLTPLLDPSTVISTHLKIWLTSAVLDRGA
jgi:hypothetical protein